MVESFSLLHIFPGMISDGSPHSRTPILLSSRSSILTASLINNPNVFTKYHEQRNHEPRLLLRIPLRIPLPVFRNQSCCLFLGDLAFPVAVPALWIVTVNLSRSIARWTFYYRNTPNSGTRYRCSQYPTIFHRIHSVTTCQTLSTTIDDHGAQTPVLKDFCPTASMYHVTICVLS